MTLETDIRNPRTERDREIAELGPWFHNLHLPDGSQTAPEHPLGDFPSFKWQKISPYLDDDLAHLTVLDIGCNAGFYAFEFAKRGASVCAIDTDEHYLRQARWAAGLYGLSDQIRFRNMQVYDIASGTGLFDLVLFMGVFYHLRYPLLALDLVARKFRKSMIFQTLTLPGEEIYPVPEDLQMENRNVMLQPGWPKMAFIEHSFAGDPTNWWAPNHAAVEAILRSAGLEILVRPGHEIYICGHVGSESKKLHAQSELRHALSAVTPHE